MPGWRPIVATEGGGCLKQGDDGHIYAHSISEEGAAKADKQFKISKKHAEVFSSLLPIVRSMPSKADVKARRAHIASALAKLGEEAKQKGEAAKQAQLAAEKKLAEMAETAVTDHRRCHWRVAS